MNQAAESSGTPTNVPHTRREYWRFVLWLLACVWLVAIIPMSLVLVGRDLDDSGFLRFGYAGLAGFWLACGRPGWWVRLFVVILIAILTGMTASAEFLEFASFTGVTIGVTAGMTYAVRMLLSYGFREDNQHRSFSIAAMMQITVVAALVVLALRYGGGLKGSPAEAALTLFYLTTLGFSLAAGCMPLWARRRRTLVGLSMSAIVCVLITLVVTVIGSALFDHDPDWFDVIKAYLVAIAGLWSLVVPLQFVLRAAKWNLVREDWLEPISDEQAASNVWIERFVSWVSPFFQIEDEHHTSAEPNWRLIGRALLLLFVVDVVVLWITSPWQRDYSVIIRLGQVGLLGFWLACGRAKWWQRCLLVAPLVLLLGWTSPNNAVGESLIFVLSLLLSTGMTFALRFVISLWSRVSNEHHTISLKGILVGMAGAALIFVVLRAMYSLSFNGSNLMDLVGGVVHVSIFGSTLVIQCAALWAGRKRFDWWWGFGFLCAVAGLLASYFVQKLSFGYTMPLEEWVEIYSIGTITIWLTAYPLDWVLRKAHWSLVQPNWELSARPSPVQADRGLVKEPHPEPARPNDLANEAVDFDDIY
ncbi:DUF805 domain-containing protein [Blastopirellula marina]|uniref:Uncharacterized protein n=1 Tax=Blastopirellula marina TaxID=124 RepID=A0A2S8FWW2_9BACT|nr:DUF805 domain-containing protein [Blastopirellula marina]PQO36671.1 hypothetical protein C5Y98_11810 [Blastopirellula marina]PTL44501.1 hypothetical protein C5Y97_11820 [Blastopirellula marina]